MIPDVLQALSKLKKQPQVMKGIRRGIERETLRVNKDGSLAKTNHPKMLGSALTHKWITTDFAETLLEFITPVDNDIDHMLTFMRDIHRYTVKNLGDERIWPLSMPCYISREEEIKLAYYGTSNIGQLKTLYRKGLKNRYGAMMQIISGVHYNFSLPIDFWKTKNKKANKETISENYFCLIRNYYRFGWIIPYLFGASPAMLSSFLTNKSTSLPFKKINRDICYLPYATSLRLSNHGYTNKLQSSLGITFNKLSEYIKILKKGIETPSKKYKKIGLEKDGHRLQINSNILQIENEFYAPIRPKCVGETTTTALQRGGVEYIEIRSLDVNPFSPIGVDERQVRFLDIFMIWCVLADAPEMSSNEMLCTQTNWNSVIIEGRKPGLTLKMGCKTTQYPLSKVVKNLFHDLKLVAQILDKVFYIKKYEKVCDEMLACFDNPELLFSTRILRSIIKRGIIETGRMLAEKYCNILQNEPLEILSEIDFDKERRASIIRQQEIEIKDTESFEVFLKKQF